MSNRQEVVEETGRECFADPARTENFRKLSKFSRKLTEEFAKSATWTAEKPKRVPKACPETALCTTQDPPGIPRRVTRLVFLLGFWHSGAAGTSAPSRKNKDSGCFGDVRIGLPQQRTQRHDKHVRPPAGFSAGKRPTASYLTRLARTTRGGLFALRVTRRGHLEVGSFESLRLWPTKKQKQKHEST